MQTLLRKSGLIAMLLMGVYAVIAFRGPNGFAALAEKRRQVTELQERNASMAAANRHRRERIERLKHSRAEQELEIRERLKKLREGEVQFIVPNPPKDDAPSTPAQK